MIQRLCWGGKAVETSSAEAVLLISSGKEPLDGILICFSRIAKWKEGMLFITVPRTGKLLLEFVSNSDSQSLGRIGTYWGTVQKRPTKTSPCCRKAFPCKASGVW